MKTILTKIHYSRRVAPKRLQPILTKIVGFSRQNPFLSKTLLVVSSASIILILLVVFWVPALISTKPPSGTSKTNLQGSNSALAKIPGLANTENNISSRSSSGGSTNTGSTKSTGSSGTSSTGSTAPEIAPPDVYPSSVLDLSNWKLTLPTDSANDGEPDEIGQPQLATFNDPPYFYVNGASSGVVFQAPVNGVTTSGSDFPRSELREMTNDGSQEASWSTTSGTSTMVVTEAITHLPTVRPQVVSAQVHGPSDYVILIRLNGNDLFVENNGNNVGTLNGNYVLGTSFTLQITAANGYIQVFYNGVQKANLANTSSGNYFKAGCYTQSNTSYGDSPSAYGQVVIYSISVNHS